MRQFAANPCGESKLRLILLSLLALFLAASTSLAQFGEELDRENGFLDSHFGDALSEIGPVITHYKSKDNRVVIVTKKDERTEWKGHKLRNVGGYVHVGYVFLDEVLVRIVAFMDPSTNYDSLLNFLTVAYGGNGQSGGSNQGLRRRNFTAEKVDLQCVYFENRVWMDIHSEPLRAEYRRWRKHHFEESERWPLPDW